MFAATVGPQRERILSNLQSLAAIDPVSRFVSCRVSIHICPLIVVAIEKASLRDL